MAAVWTLTDERKQRAHYWLPPLITGALAWCAFLVIGHTPPLRASGLALVIIGLALTLRPFGAALSAIGGLALAFSPSFWVQMGGAEQLQVGEVALALGAAAAVGGLLLVVSRKPLLGIGIALAVFAALFLVAVGTPRSLRLTTLLTAWLFYLLLDGLFLSNPRPDAPPTGQLGPQHTYGLLLLLMVGILNDPLFVLLAPAVALGLFLSGKRLPLWYWALLAVVIVYGLRGLLLLYADSGWWLVPASVVKAQAVEAPFLVADGWREPVRWFDLIALVVGQFTVAGLALGVAGVARLSRWYPPIGVVTMAAYAPFALFGLMYFGVDTPVLLLPLLMMQVVWMTYAVYTLEQWLRKSAHAAPAATRNRLAALAPAIFALLPLAMLLRIAALV